MKLFVDIGPPGRERKTFELEVREAEPGRYRVSMGGGEREVEVLEATGSETVLLTDNRATRYCFEDAHGTLSVSNGAETLEVRVTDERTRVAERLLGRHGDARGPQEVRAIMPGIVSRLLVEEGAAVEAGAPLLIIEAMKMENEVRAETRGIVGKIRVSAGTTVNAGEVLLDLGPPGDAAPPAA